MKKVVIYLVIIVFCIFLLQSNSSKEQQRTKVIAGEHSKIIEYYNSLNDECMHIVYCMNGGINHKDNLQILEFEDRTLYLKDPYKCGFYFDGWYLDPYYQRLVSKIDFEAQHNVVLYAKWIPIINNEMNVENYPYHYDEKEDPNIVCLKDCEYYFCDDIEVPGMPKTKAKDFLNDYIFSKAQCPQGLCLTEDYVLITSYSTQEDCLGVLLVMDRITGEYLTTLAMDEESHLGGIAYDGKNVWVCNSNNNTLERISYEFIEHMVVENKGKVVDATHVVDVYPVSNKPSCITFYQGRLWVATYTKFTNSTMIAYSYDNKSDSLEELGKYKIPNKVQGVTFDKEGRIILSTSMGRNFSSYIKIYSSISYMSANVRNPDLVIEALPGSEEVDIYDEELYVIFETAGEKYLEGTDGNGRSEYPLDQILVIPLDELPES